MIFLPYITSKSTLFQFKHITLCPVYTDNYKKNNNIKIKKKKSSFQVPLIYWKGAITCLEPSLLVEQPQYSQSFFVEELFHLFDHFHGLPL